MVASANFIDALFDFLDEFFDELRDWQKATPHWQRAARRAAARLGFRVSTDGEAISGGVRGFQVTLRRVGSVVNRPDAHRLIITVDGGGAIPRDLALGTESGDPEFFSGMSGVPTDTDGGADT